MGNRVIVSKHNSDLTNLIALKKPDLMSIVSKVNAEESPKKHINLWKV